MPRSDRYPAFRSLLGKTILKIEGGNPGDESITFYVNDLQTYKMYHEQDCCENVRIEDVIGRLSDLIGSPLIEADTSCNHDNPPHDEYGSHTWTFYRMATAKGFVTIRWYGESNGYYSGGVSFVRLNMH